jgi:hypothetical protein
MKRWLFEAFDKELKGGFYLFFWCEDFWERIAEVLEGDEGEVVRVRFVDFCLKAKYKDNSLRN